MKSGLGLTNPDIADITANNSDSIKRLLNQIKRYHVLCFSYFAVYVKIYILLFGGLNFYYYLCNVIN